jgi:uncharacterized protein YjbI with pentapeptide repeats
MAKKQDIASAERLAAEGGIASDESTVKVLEIGANEGPVEEYEKGPDASAAAEGDSGEAGCPIRMGGKDAPICGRKLHIAPDGVDEQPVCLMHSKDPGKQAGLLIEEFRMEFERIMEEAGEGEAHFQYFVFPKLDFRGRKFQAICWFDYTIFTQSATFIDATFAGKANFLGATFEQKAFFYKVKFAHEANFTGANFTQGARFDGATFTQTAVFVSVTFKEESNFTGATFIHDAHFVGATFIQKADFSRAKFTEGANFIGTTFIQDALFCRATFTQIAVFFGVKFKEEANFTDATFAQDGYFNNAIFTKAALFKDTIFYGTANLGESRFFDQAEFRGTLFRPQVKEKPSALFALAKFSKPGEVVFDDVDLSRALFSNCDISQVWFTSSVQWGKREGSHGLAVFDESIPLEQEFALSLQRDGQRDYSAVAQIYHQLKKNYDSRLEYRTANDFHYGEMEMMRLSLPTRGRLLWLRRRLHRMLSPVAIYRWASDYGNNYWKPLLRLFGTLMVAALLFLITGLELKQASSGNAASPASVTYSGVWDKNNSWTNNFWTEAKLIGKSGITATDTATFQRTPEYAPAYPWGRVVGIVETLLTSSLFALFLLAIRRQFRR